MNQSTALSLLKSGKNVFLTGSAGAGKTYVLNQYIEYLKERKVPVAVTASTGIAATHMNGMTIHSWAGIGIRTVITQSDLVFMSKKKYLRDKMEIAKVLIIDEISMLHRVQLDMINQVLKFFKKNNRPFGGIQVIFSGDFFQLPPVGNNENNREKFCFMSMAWVASNLAICYLTEQHRQSDSHLNNILNEIRSVQVSETSLELLRMAKNTEFKVGWQPPILYSHNQDVNRTNNKYLRDLSGKMTIFEATTKGNKKLVDLLKNSVRAEDSLYIKVGAKVMFVKNNYEKNYINGTLGTVVGYSEDLPVVELTDGKKMTVQPETWAIEDEMGKPLASFNQIPIRLAWAITVHKSQGMTLDYAQVDLSRTFERGQGYVALSRLKDIKGLKLMGFNDIALQVDPLAFKADKRFQELSEVAELGFNQQQSEKQAINFVKHCGGITDPEEIERQKKKKKEKIKVKKTPTHLVSKEYIEKGLSLEKIAEERGLKVGTITNHLFKLKDLFPNLDISPYAPASGILHRVQTSYNSIIAENDSEKIKPDGSVSSKALYESMNQEVGYTEIKLAMIFIKK
jgi:hypothetical protein